MFWVPFSRFRVDNSVPEGLVGLSNIQRQWLQVSLNESISFKPYHAKSSEAELPKNMFLFLEVSPSLSQTEYLLLLG